MTLNPKKRPSLVWVILLLGLGGCGFFAPPQSQQTPAGEEPETSLTFRNITLEQVDDEGQLLWRVQAQQAEYSQDNQVAQIYNPTGELFQDGKQVFKIQAKRGEVQKEGNVIVLKDDIVATDTQDGVVLRGNEMEWRPKEDLLRVRNNLTGTHEQIEAAAQEARAYSRDRRIEFLGKVVATTQDPVLQLRTEHLVWKVGEELLTGGRVKPDTDYRIEIDRFVENTVTDRAVATQAEVNLKTKIATLRQNARLNFSEPPVEVNSQTMTWNLNQQTVASDSPVEVLHQEQEVRMTAQRGQLDLEKRIFYLIGAVEGIGQRNQARLNAEQLTWFVPTQEVAAEGNVVYRQVDPPLHLRGAKAFGRLQDQTVTVSGGGVITEIIP